MDEKIARQGIIKILKWLRRSMRTCCGFDLDGLLEAVTLQKSTKELKTEAVQHYLDCLCAARAEGLEEAIINTDDEKLRDLLTRRLLFDAEQVFLKALKNDDEQSL